MNKKIQVIDGIGRKIVQPDSFSIELEKTKQAGRIGEQTGLFYVPRIMGFNEKESFIDYEYIDGLHTVQEITISNHSQLINIYTRIGAALAAIHNNLILPPEMKKNLPDIWMHPESDNIFIHGDFTLHNVCFHKATNRIVILDWSAAPFIGAQHTFGSRYFDITWFIYYIFHFLPAKTITRWRAKNMADAFLKGYIEQRQTCLHLQTFRYYHLEIEKIKRKKFSSGAKRHPLYTRAGYFLLWFWKRYRYRRYSNSVSIDRIFN
jgi:tRNA A-37 threonylcarbamoyl transferase component Bud32